MVLEVFGILIVILGLTLSTSVVLSKNKISSISPLSFMVFTVSLNFLNLLLIQFSLIPASFNFFGLYAILYGIFLRQYRIKVQTKKSINPYISIFEFLLLFFVILYIVIQLTLDYKIQFFGFDDLETLPGILLMSYHSIKGALSYYRRKEKKGLAIVLFGSTCILSLLLIIEFLTNPNRNATIVTYLIFSIFIITYVLLNLLLIYELRFSKSTNFLVPTKYTTSNLKEKEISTIADQLISNIENSKSFLQPNYTLNQLSIELGVSKSHISQVLNEHFKKSFFEFINTLRIEEAIKIMKSDSTFQMSIKEIMYSVGFNTKSTFIKYFKKVTGHSPTQFRDHIK